MEYEILGANGKIDFGATGAAEVVQNVRIILTTPKFSVALDREFGIDFSILDRPIPITQARLAAVLHTAIREYEPRFRVTKIDFIQDVANMLDGKIIPRVRGEIIL